MDVIFKETISEISGIDYLFEKYKTLFALKESDSPDDVMPYYLPVRQDKELAPAWSNSLYHKEIVV